MTALVTIAPEVWHEWLQFLISNTAQTQNEVGLNLPPILRIPSALLITVWGARNDRFWALPVAMLVASPGPALAGLSILAAIPRLQLEQQAQHQARPR